MVTDWMHHSCFLEKLIYIATCLVFQISDCSSTAFCKVLYSGKKKRAKWQKRKKNKTKTELIQQQNSDLFQCFLHVKAAKDQIYYCV